MPLLNRDLYDKLITVRPTLATCHMHIVDRLSKAPPSTNSTYIEYYLSMYYSHFKGM